MAGSATAISLHKTLGCGDAKERIAELELRPLPWPESTTQVDEAHRPHAHRCVLCDIGFECGGPDQTGECAPLCPPCLWVELGSQLRQYHAMFEAISRRRRKIARQIGDEACRAARTRRRATIRERNLLVGLGGIVLQRSGESSNSSVSASRSTPAGEDFENSPR